jgi:hypothetical protein
MADKTVLDYTEITTQVLEDDIIYIIRGTGVGRDRKMEAEKIIGNVISQDVTGSIDLSTYFHDLVIVSDPASEITITLSNALQSGRKLYVINKNASNNVLLAGTFGATVFSGSTLFLISDGTALYNPGSKKQSIKSVSGANYTILDNDGFDIIRASSTTADRTILMPTLADNIGRKLTIYKEDYNPTSVIVDGEGSETIEDSLTYELSRQGDSITLLGTSTKWKIISINSKWIDTGWINRSDWTNVHLGNIEVDYDNLSGSFTVGAIVTGGTSGTTGKILADNGSTLILENVTNGGIFVNDEGLTDDSTGVTADVNEPSGDNKNQDSNISHYLNSNISDIDVQLFISTDGTDANSFLLIDVTSVTVNGGHTMYQASVDTAFFQTQNGGLARIDGTGAIQSIDTEDWYYKIKYKKREVI